MTIPRFLDELDLSIFSVPSATTDNDKMSLLRLQKLVSSTKQYNYLEIGSDRGGSLVPLLSDPNCKNIISVDLRPEQQPDERGISFPYPNDGEAQMLTNLRQCLEDIQLVRLKTFKLDLRDVNAASVPKIDLVLIDGEHTDVACFSDADRVLDFINSDAVIAFHDSNLVADAIQNFERMLNRLGIEHSTVFLADVVGAIGLGKFARALEKELGALSAPRSPFFAEAQLHRWVSVANSMRHRGLIPNQTPEQESEMAGLRSQIVSLETQLTHEGHSVEILREELELLQNRINMLTQSTSWKLTAPLRYLKRLLK